MKNVVDLSEYRLTHTAASIRSNAHRAELSTHSPEHAKPAYYCMRCDGDAFRIFASGEIHCVQCGKRMRNILAAVSSHGEKVSQ